MTEYMTEQEQIQQIKTWLKSYGPYVLAGLIIAGLLSGGWHIWQRHRTKVLTHASRIYDEMLAHRAQNDAAAADVQANKLLTHYASTPYADMAAFMLARSAVGTHRYSAAQEQLNWVIDHSNRAQLRDIARIRLARIQIANNDVDTALATLDQVKDNTFLGMVNEIRGDAYAAKNKLSDAKKAYQLALQEIPNAEVARPILQMKYENL